MKRMMLVLLILAGIGSLRAQDVDRLAVGYAYKDTLSGTRDTIQVAFRGQELEISYYSLILFRSTAGFDTVKVYELAGDGSTWYQEALTDMVAGTDSTQMTITTTPRAFMFQQPFTKVRIVSNDGVKSTIMILQGRTWP